MKSNGKETKVSELEGVDYAVADCCSIVNLGWDRLRKECKLNQIKIILLLSVENELIKLRCNPKADQRTREAASHFLAKKDKWVRKGWLIMVNTTTTCHADPTIIGFFDKIKANQRSKYILITNDFDLREDTKNFFATSIITPNLRIFKLLESGRLIND